MTDHHKKKRKKHYIIGPYNWIRIENGLIGAISHAGIPVMSGIPPSWIYDMTGEQQAGTYMANWGWPILSTISNKLLSGISKI